MTGAETTLVFALSVNGLLALGYRLYRFTKGGPIADAIGGAAIAVLLGVLGAFIAAGAGWPRWPALVYALLFALVVMPIWTLSVLIPLPPRAPDYAFAGLYWVTLLAIAAGAIAV